MSIIENMLKELLSHIDGIEDNDKKIEALNEARMLISSVSPLKHHPVDCVQWLKSEKVEGNEYNPNSVAPPEMELLKRSIIEDGYTMPIVTFPQEGENVIKIVDGFHRRKSERMVPEISESTFGYVPATFIRSSKSDISDRMASTIRHNRARGSHNIELMSEIVTDLVGAGKGDAWICKHIGMSKDELLRLKQITGLAKLFENKEFSNSWDAVEA